jgi:hypothetical protein
LVAELFRRYADGSASIAELTRWLTDQGVATRTGKSRKYTDAQIAADPNLGTYTVQEDKRDCMDGGWQAFEQPAFASQGECVAYFQRARP